MIIEFTKLDLPAPVASATSRCGIREVGHDVASLDVLADPHDHQVLGPSATWLRSMSPRLTFSRSVLDLDADGPPGMGLRIRTSADATAYAMFPDRVADLARP